MGTNNSKYEPNKDPSPIKHVIYVMFENNSFDQIYGGFDQYKLNTPNSLNSNFTPITTVIPEDDFPHAHKNTMIQLGLTNGNTNANNSGFEQALDSFDIKNHISTEIHEKRLTEMKGYLKPGTLPVFHELASQFTLCNNYFCSFPGGTWCNRFFALSGTSKGQVTNKDISDVGGELFIADQVTLFDRLNEKDVSWGIYHHDVPSCLTLLNMWKPQCLDKIYGIQKFYDDCAKGSLPSFSFIEPKYSGAGQTDMHPPSNKLNGDHLLGRIYATLRSNEKLWESTLLIVNFDEHGGYDDHVFPPKTIAPDNYTQQYSFDNLGVRVPCLLISPYLANGGVISDVMDHTSILHYLINKYKLGALGKRAAKANTFEKYFLPNLRNDTPTSKSINAIITPLDEKVYTQLTNTIIANEFYEPFWKSVLDIMHYLHIPVTDHESITLGDVPKSLEYFKQQIKNKN